jgi:hypothetical protein
LTRSGARQRPLPGRVVDRRFFFRLAARPCSRMRAATVFVLTARPASRRSAVIRGDPQVPRCALNRRRTSAASASLRAARSGSRPFIHLQDQDRDTPSAPAGGRVRDLVLIPLGGDQGGHRYRPIASLTLS